MMSNLNNTPSANRLHIGFLGRTNSGKSSLINAFVNQKVSIVSQFAGTTTDPVYKAMEIHGLGPCVLIDTAGFDDASNLGQQRLDKTAKVSDKVDVAIVLFNQSDSSLETAWWDKLKAKKIPIIPVVTKSDLGIDYNLVSRIETVFHQKPIIVSAVEKKGLDELKEAIIKVVPDDFEKSSITGNLVKTGDVVLLVMPQDIQAPKGRLILPQVQVIRELLDKKCIVVSSTTDQLVNTLASLKNKPDLVITDSQVFKYVDEIISDDIKLTSFSILMAGYKGDLSYYVESVKKLTDLADDCRILIAECCSHAPLSEDIGRVKIPLMLSQRFSKVKVDIVSGTDFPDDLTPYDLIITCGGCMFNRRYIMNRVNNAKQQNVAMTNYGIFIAYVSGILERVIC